MVEVVMRAWPMLLVLNIYWARSEVLRGDWLPPPIRAFARAFLEECGTG